MLDVAVIGGQDLSQRRPGRDDKRVDLVIPELRVQADDAQGQATQGQDRQDADDRIDDREPQAGRTIGS